MWPLASANTDSDWASLSRCSSVSRTAHGSTGYDGCSIIGSRVQQFGEVLDHDVGPVLLERRGMIDAIDADDEAEAAVVAGLDPGGGVLVHDRVGRLDAQRLGAGPGRVRGGACA